MRKFFIIAVFIFAAESFATPRLVLPKVTYDFKSVQEGEVVKAAFNLKNQGSSALLIKKIFPACGCTVAEMTSKEIAPGKTGTLKVNFDTSGFHGQKIKTVRLFTNDPKRSTVVLSIQGKVKRDIEIEPSRLYFGATVKGSNKTVSANITTSKGVSILGIIPRSDDINVVEKNIPGGIRITAKLSDDVPVGILRNRIVVKTNSKHNPVLNIPVFARVEGDLNMNPSDVSFGLIDGPLGQDVVTKVRVKNRSAKPVKILSTKSNTASVKTDFVVIKEGYEYEVSVAIAKKSFGVVRDRVVITTDHVDEKQRKLELPVYGIISN